MLFHHSFQQIIPILGMEILTAGQYSVEFEPQGVFLLLHLRFGKVNRLCRVYLSRTGRINGQTSAELQLVSTLLAAISTEADLVCSSGATYNLVQMLDRAPFSRHGVQRPTLFDDNAIKKLMHKDSYSVFGRIDFFLTVPGHLFEQQLANGRDFVHSRTDQGWTLGLLPLIFLKLYHTPM